MTHKPQSATTVDVTSTPRPANDSSPTRGGAIPGYSGAHAFELIAPEPSPVPVVIAVPHAGRAYPPGVIEAMRDPSYSALRLEDRYVDRIARQVARATGATLLVAHAPRAMIDLNRSVEEMDWSMLAEASPSDRTIARRARSGLGLVPRRLPGLGEVWKWPLGKEELEQRIAGIHGPYHAALQRVLGTIRKRWGAALLVDLHSMPPLTPRSGKPAQFVLGDRFGASCDGSLVGAAFESLDHAGSIAAHNRPYAGGYVLDRHAAPRRNIHALQVEICRSTYLDARFAEPGPGFDRTCEVLVAMVQRLAAATADIARGETVRDAAE